MIVLYGVIPLRQETAPGTEGATSPRKGPGGTIRFSVKGKLTPYAGVNECRACKRVVSLLGRKHHCRGCGEVFCNACTTPRVLAEAPALVHVLGATRPQRLCLVCKTCMPEPAVAAGNPRLRAPLPINGEKVLPSTSASGAARPAMPATLTAGVNGEVQETNLDRGLATFGSVVEVATAGIASPIASTVGALAVAAVSASGVADMAGQALMGLLAVAERFPMGSLCCGLLKDMVALYQVRCTIIVIIHTCVCEICAEFTSLAS